MAEDPRLGAMIDGLFRGEIDLGGGDPTLDRGMAKLLGFQWAPGEIVRDTVTGQIATVVHVSKRAVLGPPPK